MTRDPRTTAITMILAILEDQPDHDPRLDVVVEVGLREIFGLADRMTQAAERQAEALERIHARLGFGLIDACPECGAILADNPRVEAEP